MEGQGALLGAELGSKHRDKQVFWEQREGQHDCYNIGKWKGSRIERWRGRGGAKEEGMCVAMGTRGCNGSLA